MAKGPVLKYKTPQALLDKGYEYINAAKALNEPILFSKLLLHLGIANSTLNVYEQRIPYSETVKRLKLEVQAYAEEKLYGKSTLAGMFVLKNFGWQEETQTSSGTLTIKWVNPGKNKKK